MVLALWLGLGGLRPDSIAIYTSLQLAVLDEFSDVTYTIRGKALTARKDGNRNAEREMKV